MGDEIQPGAQAPSGPSDSESVMSVPGPLALEVVYSLTPEDLLEATLGRIEAAKAMRQQVRLVRILGIALVVLALAPILIGAWVSDPVGLFIGVVAMAIGLYYAIFAKRLAFGRTRKVNQKIFQERWTPAMSLPTRLVISERGIATASELSSSNVAWPAVAEIQRGETMLVFWLGPHGIIVPRRVFLSAEDFDRFAQWAEYWRRQTPALP